MIYLTNLVSLPFQLLFTNNKTKKEVEFDDPYNRWLSRSEDDFDVCRELPVKSRKQPIPGAELKTSPFYIAKVMDIVTLGLWVPLCIILLV